MPAVAFWEAMGLGLETQGLQGNSTTQASACNLGLKLDEARLLQIKSCSKICFLSQPLMRLGGL